MTSTTATTWQYEPQLVGRTVQALVGPLQQQYLKDTPSAVARLAQLRRGAGKAPEEVPELYGLTGTEKLYDEGPLRGKDEERATYALHMAVTLHALHQQSQRSKPMHRPGYELGAAVRMLMPPGEINEPLRVRFVRVGTATSAGVLAYRLREIVLLLRRESIPLDYAMLADQLERVLDPRRAPQVRQEWGRGFHAWRRKKDEGSDDPDSGEENAPADG